MKKIFFLCLIFSLSLAIKAQNFEWKRLSYDITDTSYCSSKTTTDIVKNGSNYYFAFYGGPVEVDNWPLPSTWLPGYFYPTVLSDNNQLVMIDTISLDSVEIFYYHYKTFVQNDTFRVLVNYPYLDSANFQDYSMFRKGLPVPKCKGFLLLNYTLSGQFAGYDSLPLPPSLVEKANVNSLNDTKALNVVNLYVDDNNEMFLYLGYWKRGTGSTGHVQPLDTIGYIVKYHSDLTPDSKVVPIMLRTDNSGYDYKINLKLHNNELYLLGQINDTTIVDNLFFASDSINGYNTFAIEFNPDLYVVNTAVLPGTFYDFSIDNSDRFFVSGGYNYPMIIGNDSIFPSVYMDPYDTVVQYDALLMRLSPGMDMEKFVYILSGCKPPSIYSNNSRIFGESMGGCGRFVTDNNDTIDNPIVNVPGANNLFLFNTNTLFPSWQYNFPVDNNINGLYFFDDKIIESYSTSYYFLAGFGDQDTLFLSGDYYPVAIAQIGILGLGLENQLPTGALSVLIYPNPAQDQVQIVLPNETGGQIAVYDISGKLQLLQTSNSRLTQLNVSSLQPGMYIVRIVCNSEVYSGKFLKN